MIDISEVERETWLSGTQKNLTLTFDDGTVISNDDIYSESMTIEQTLCDEPNIKYGKCSAAMFKVMIADTAVSFKGKQFTATIECGGYTRPLGVYRVYSDNRTDDKRYKDIVGYDEIYTVSNIDCTEWYNGLTFPISMTSFRNGFFSFVGIEQESDPYLPNDGMMIEKTIDPSSISALTIMQAICELNGRFGQIGMDGKFYYVDIDNALYPIYPSEDLYPADDLFPKDEMHHLLTLNDYSQGTFKYEDFKTQKITKVVVREQDGDVGGSAGADGNTYYVTGNFIAYGQPQQSLNEIAGGIFNEIGNISYSPASVTTMYFAPWTEIGDWVKVVGVADAIVFPILKRTISGITGAKETYTAGGTETANENASSILDEIVQLKGQSNVLKRDINQTQSTIMGLSESVDGQVEQLQSQITQNAESITLEASRASTQEGQLSSRIQQTANGLTSEITRATEAEGNLSSTITQTASSLRSEISDAVTETKTYADTAAGTAESNAKADTTEKLKSYSTTTQMNSAISVAAGKITSEVSKTYTTKDSFGKLETRVTSAESKITDVAIINTVTSSDDYKDLSTTVTQTAEGLDWIIDGDGKTTQYSISNAGMKFIGDNVEIDADQVTFSANDYRILSNNIVLSGSNIHLDGNTVVGEGFSIGWGSLPDDVADSDDIPTKISDLANDSGFQTSSQVTQITKNTITSTYIKGLNLQVGNEITMGVNATISWNKVTDKGNVANKSDIPTDVNQLSDASGQKWSTSVGNSWIQTTNVLAQNLQVNAAKINGELTAGQINAKGLSVTDGTFSGSITSNSGTIGGWTIGNNDKYGNCLYSEDSSGIIALTTDDINLTNGTITTTIDKSGISSIDENGGSYYLGGGDLYLYNKNKSVAFRLYSNNNRFSEYGMVMYGADGRTNNFRIEGLSGNVYSRGDISANTFTENGTELSDKYAAKSHTHTKSQITDFPTSLPASDVYSWAKASVRPSYSFGLWHKYYLPDAADISSGADWQTHPKTTVVNAAQLDGTGYYLFIIVAQFATNATGKRGVRLHKGSGTSLGIMYGDWRSAMASNVTVCSVVCYANVVNGTSGGDINNYDSGDISVYQNSGSVISTTVRMQVIKLTNYTLS